MRPIQKNDNFRQGLFKPKNPQKYLGKGLPVYRSGWELKFFRWCDDNPNVLEWASESVIIPYISPIDHKVHRYYTDGIIAIKEAEGIKKYIIEIKPSKQTIKPENSSRKKLSTKIYEATRYAQNIAKWDAAKKWCDKKGYKFLILTEKELGIR